MLCGIPGLPLGDGPWSLDSETAGSSIGWHEETSVDTMNEPMLSREKSVVRCTQGLPINGVIDLNIEQDVETTEGLFNKPILKVYKSILWIELGAPIGGTFLSRGVDKVGLDIETSKSGSSKPLSKFNNSKQGESISDTLRSNDGDNIGWDIGTSEGVSNKQL